ncbi:MAG TPA: hypothetical protein VMV73_00695 [Candidatus Dormibacteraeota bacterium]|nr:hypothetical protein [Candidatus Dormibacteraeota bacterium]
MRTTFAIRVLVCLLAWATLAGCGGAVASARNAECKAIGTLIAPPIMLYPVANATGVPDGNFTLVLASTYGNSLSLVSSGNANLQLATTAVPSPLPTPNVSPPPGSTPAGFAVGALAAHTTYTIAASFTQPAGCPNVTGNVGTFTTQ